jgi:hypothetical protein
MATEAQCKRALDLFEEDLSARKNVVGLGIVPATDEAGKGGKPQMAVAVYVTKKVPENKLAAKDLVPKTLQVRTARGEVTVPTRVIEEGEFKLE